MEFKDIKELIEQYDSIVLYRHIDPDYDAYGSQLGLKHIIKENWPDKKVYTYGKEIIDNRPFVDDMDNPSLDIIRQSLTIITDTSTNRRADDTSFMEGKCILKIDHHLRSEVVSEHMYVDPESESASTIVADFAIKTGLKINKQAATFLYAGMLTDTNRFSIDKCNSRTFEILAVLASKGIDIPQINRETFDLSTNEYQASIYLQSLSRFEGNFAYFIAKNEDRAKFNLTDGETKDFVHIYSNIKGVDKYAVFAQKDNGNYTGSLRSHLNSVVHVAEKFGGGGHALACGIPEMNEQELLQCIEMMKEA